MINGKLTDPEMATYLSDDPDRPRRQTRADLNLRYEQLRLDLQRLSGWRDTDKLAGFYAERVDPRHESAMLVRLARLLDETRAVMDNPAPSPPLSSTVLRREIIARIERDLTALKVMT